MFQNNTLAISTVCGAAGNENSTIVAGDNGHVSVRNNNTPGGIVPSNYGQQHRERCLSPTSNQLAQWFSPELLAQASAGKLPLLNASQTVSLEEFERNIQHSTAIVHN